MPTTCLSGPACNAPAHEPIVSIRAQLAPPCSRPKGCSLPSTGMVATSRSGSKSMIRMPSLSSSGLSLSAGIQAGGAVVTEATVTSRWPHIGSAPMSAPVSTSAPTATLPTGERPRLLLLDGHSLAYRAFFALPVENFSTTTGQPTNAVYGFTSMLINILRDEKPTHLAVAFDVGRKTFRSEIYADYKANRSESPTDFRGQVSLVQEVLGALRVPVIT